MLTADETQIAQHLLMDDEGIELFPYFDCCGKFFRKCSCAKQGKLTLGIGRNIEDIGISENEAIGLCLNDVKRVTVEIEKNFPWFKTLNTPRRIVIFSMCFNLGIQGFKGFKKAIKCIESGDFASAAKEMLTSQWASQVKERANRLARILETGQF